MPVGRRLFHKDRKDKLHAMRRQINKLTLKETSKPSGEPPPILTKERQKDTHRESERGNEEEKKRKKEKRSKERKGSKTHKQNQKNKIDRHTLHLASDSSSQT